MLQISELEKAQNVHTQTFEAFELSSKVRDFRQRETKTRCTNVYFLNLEWSILNSCSEIATKVRDHRPKMSSKVRDSGQNVRTHRVQRVQLFPALIDSS